MSVFHVAAGAALLIAGLLLASFVTAAVHDSAMATDHAGSAPVPAGTARQV